MSSVFASCTSSKAENEIEFVLVVKMDGRALIDHKKYKPHAPSPPVHVFFYVYASQVPSSTFERVHSSFSPAQNSLDPRPGARRLVSFRFVSPTRCFIVARYKAGCTTVAKLREAHRWLRSFRATTACTCRTRSYPRVLNTKAKILCYKI